MVSVTKNGAGIDPRDHSMSGRWIGQRTCSWCGFSGPEPEFMAVGLIDHGEDVEVVPLDEAAEKMTTVCCACAAHLGRWHHEALRRAIAHLIERAL